MKFDLRSINFHRTFHFASYRFAFDDNLSDCQALIDLLNYDRYATRPIPIFAFKCRLRSLLERVEKGNNISREELRGTIKLAICVVQRAFREEEEKPVVGDDDDDNVEILSRVETNVVPAEVRDWLAMTFSRTSSSCPVKRPPREKPKFRSVANAIRAGIMVDKIYRRICGTAGFKIPAKVAAQMKSINDWSFDVFKLNEVSEGHSLKYIGYELLQRYDFISKFKINLQKLDHFLTRLEQGYSKYQNPYHNLIHAADVAQSVNHIFNSSGLTTWFSDLEVFSAIFASLIHDFEHTGTTNTFHINTSSEPALIYNDKAVLENHHLSATFRMLKEDEINILSNLKKDDYRELRAIVIDVVLATDMSLHCQQIKSVRHSINTLETIDKTKALSLIVHCCDISHPAKDWDLHHRWTELLMEEFFRQGDQEALMDLPTSPLCDRKTTHVAESQIGFINFIVDPSLQVMGDMADRLVFLMNKPRSNNNNSNPCDDNDNKANNANNFLTNETSRIIPRAWENCLSINKQKWKERSVNGWISPLQVKCSTEADKSAADGPNAGDQPTIKLSSADDSEPGDSNENTEQAIEMQNLD